VNLGTRVSTLSLCEENRIGNYTGRITQATCEPIVLGPGVVQNVVHFNLEPLRLSR